MDRKELLARALGAHDDIKAMLAGFENTEPIYQDTDSCIVQLKVPRTGRETIQISNAPTPVSTTGVKQDASTGVK